jgi:hypothetical protein
MSEDRDDLIRHYQTMRRDLLDSIAGLTDAQLTEPTLDGWSVKDHLAHIACWDEARAAEIARVSAGHAAVLRSISNQEETFNDLCHQLWQPRSLEQVRWELAATRQRVLDAIASATDHGLDPSRYAEAALRSDHEAEHTRWIWRWRKEQG